MKEGVTEDVEPLATREARPAITPDAADDATATPPAMPRSRSAAPPGGPSMPRVLRLSLAVMLSVAGIWASAGFKRLEPPPPASTPGMSVKGDTLTLAPDAPQWSMVKVGTARPAAARWTDPVPARIRIDEKLASKVGAPLSGRITRVFVELGQKVAAGAPLFTVSSQEIADLRAQKEKAQVNLEAAKVTLDRVKAMVAASALPAREQLGAEQEYKQAALELRFAEAKLEALRVSTGRDNEFTVTAPRAGVVVEKNVLEGQQVARESGETLLVVADLSTVWIVADLFEADATQVGEEAKAEVSIPSLPDVKLEGTVEMVSAVVDPVRHTVPIRVHVANPDGVLRPNIYALVRFTAAARPGAVEVPAAALVSDGDHQYVYVQEARGRFVRRGVVAGSTHGGLTPVLSGLKAGEALVEEGAILLDNQVNLAKG
jgi:RND family efflux transporter MFP subunit